MDEEVTGKKGEEGGEVKGRREGTEIDGDEQTEDRCVCV